MEGHQDAYRVEALVVYDERARELGFLCFENSWLKVDCFLQLFNRGLQIRAPGGPAC